MVMVKGLVGTDFSFCYIKRDLRFIRMIGNFGSITFMEKEKMEGENGGYIRR
jgi:hypothetical protein